MLYIKEANLENCEEEYRFISQLPYDENGFLNIHANCTFQQFQEYILPNYIANAKGKNLALNHVPETKYFLWLDQHIIGLFKLRHYLNDTLKNGAGHIGYGISHDYRGQGYGTKGLALVIKKAWDIIPENEIYLSCLKKNPASLAVMLKNGAYIHHEDEMEYYTRIKRTKKEISN